MTDGGRPRALGYTDDFDEWMSHLPDAHQRAIDRHVVREIAMPLQ
jgi:hypothetical protein